MPAHEVIKQSLDFAAKTDDVDKKTEFEEKLYARYTAKKPVGKAGLNNTNVWSEWYSKLPDEDKPSKDALSKIMIPKAPRIPLPVYTSWKKNNPLVLGAFAALPVPPESPVLPVFSPPCASLLKAPSLKKV